eukprot:scaffold10272_cov276-Chaetoceros_neogracile.AAC.32
MQKAKDTKGFKRFLPNRLTIAKEKIFRKGPRIWYIGFTHGSVSDNIMEGALLITLAIVSMSTGTMFIWVAATFEMGTGLDETIAFVDGPTNAFTACARISASVRLLKSVGGSLIEKRCVKNRAMTHDVQCVMWNEKVTIKN